MHPHKSKKPPPARPSWRHRPNFRRHVIKLQRRTLLRGMFQGSVAVMGVPFLDCFLDSKGQALAATGQRIPTRFSTFFFGLGLTTKLWVPRKTGLDYDTTTQLKPLEPF